jgi:hypothetical protein
MLITKRKPSRSREPIRSAGQELRIAFHNAAAESNKSGTQHCATRFGGMSGCNNTASDCHPEQAEHRDGTDEDIGVRRVCKSAEAMTERRHIPRIRAWVSTALLPKMAANGGRKGPFGFPTPTARGGLLLLRSWDGGRESSDTSSGIREPSREILAERLCAGRNGEGYEDDKHGIFGGAGPALVTAQSGNQTDHLTSPFRNGVRPYFR